MCSMCAEEVPIHSHQLSRFESYFHCARRLEGFATSLLHAKESSKDYAGLQSNLFFRFELRMVHLQHVCKCCQMSLEGGCGTAILGELSLPSLQVALFFDRSLRTTSTLPTCTVVETVNQSLAKEQRELVLHKPSSLAKEMGRLSSHLDISL